MESNKYVKSFSLYESELNEASNPNDKMVIDVDLSSDDKDVMAAMKKYKVTATQNGANDGSGYDLEGKRKDLIAYLTSDYFGLVMDDIEDMYPELLESKLLEGKRRVPYKEISGGARLMNGRGKTVTVSDIEYGNGEWRITLLDDNGKERKIKGSENGKGPALFLDESLTEGRKVQVKRKYGDREATKVSLYGPVRETVLSHVAEKGGTISKDELKEFLKGMNETKGTKTSFGWVKRNARYLKETKKGYQLTKLGKRVLKYTRINESNEMIFEGQFSWYTQDSKQQIGSERENTIVVYMFDDKGNKWEEKKYEGYGQFGGKDYYEVVAEMNGYVAGDENDPKLKLSYSPSLRQIGIDVQYGKIKTKNKDKKIRFPALVANKNYNWKRHDFTVAPENDPDQSWYMEPEDDDDNGGYYDEY